MDAPCPYNPASPKPSVSPKRQTGLALFAWRVRATGWLPGYTTTLRQNPPGGASPISPRLETLSPKPTPASSLPPGGPDAGRLFSLDGVPPTTIGYGYGAGLLTSCAAASVYLGDGRTRHGPVEVTSGSSWPRHSLPPRGHRSDLRLARCIARSRRIFDALAF